MGFTTNARIDPPTTAELGLLDLWFMDQFARHLARRTGLQRPREVGTLSVSLGVCQVYYHDFPRDVATPQQRYGALRD